MKGGNASLLADFTSHHIEGFTNEGNHQFKVSLISHICDNLYVGGCPVGQAPKEIQFIVSAYPWAPYEIHEHQVVTQAQLFDHGEVPDEGILLALARHVNECRKVGKTLVHCQAGLNRSNLIAALALMEGGMPAIEAISLLRERRCSAVLCNRAFEGWLLDRGKPKLEFS